MTLKPTTFLVGTFFVSLSAFSQFTYDFVVMNNLNPAMVGLDYKSSGNLMLTGDRAKHGNYSAVFGNYSGFISKYNIGFGVSSYNQNTTWTSSFDITNNITKLSINKQFRLQNNLTLSTGLGVGLSSLNYYYSESTNTESLNRSKGLGFDAGFALKGEKFKVGFDAGYQFPMDKGYNSQILLNVFGSYTFGKEDGLQFTPHALLSQIGPSIGGTFNYKSKYMLGGGVSGNLNIPSSLRPYITAGYTIKNKFNINYAYSFYGSSLSPKPRHQLTLGFQLGKK